MLAASLDCKDASPWQGGDKGWSAGPHLLHGKQDAADRGAKCCRARGQRAAHVGACPGTHWTQQAHTCLRTHVRSLGAWLLARLAARGLAGMRPQQRQPAQRLPAAARTYGNAARAAHGHIVPVLHGLAEVAAQPPAQLRLHLAARPPARGRGEARARSALATAGGWGGHGAARHCQLAWVLRQWSYMTKPVCNSSSSSPEEARAQGRAHMRWGTPVQAAGRPHCALC